MMSASNVSAGAAASGYYKAEGYYIAGSPEAEAAASWFGKGAEHLVEAGQSEFADRIDDKTFSDMLEGHAPPTEKDKDGEWKEGQTLGRIVDGERQHRPGLDLTFSANKSVSVMALVVGDERVTAAHDAAVKSAMGFVEDRYVTTRREVDGEMQQVSGKMIAGLFRHDTSRALDPQLHTHAVIQNMVLSEDGKWTALSNEQIYRNKMLIGAVYRNELAQNLEKIGYEVDRTGKDGITEIRGVPKELMDGFSKRRQEIEAALDERGGDRSAVSSALAALATRRSKSSGIERDELKDAWAKEAQTFGFSLDQLQKVRDDAGLAKALQLPGASREPTLPDTPQQIGAKAVEFAIQHISERAAVYSEADVLKTALNTTKGASIEHIEGAMKAAEASGRLVSVHVHEWKEVQEKGGTKGGTLKDFGPAPYQNDPKNKESYYVTVQTAGSEHTIWGVDMKRAIEAAEVQKGDSVYLSRTGDQAVTVTDKAGQQIDTRRNSWQVTKADPEDRTFQERTTVKLFTDDATLAAERRVLQEWRDARGERPPALPPYVNGAGKQIKTGETRLKNDLDKTTLTQGQKDAIVNGLTGTGRYKGVQGYAGTGKTYMLSVLRSYAEKAGYAVEGAAATIKAVSELNSAISNPTTTAMLKINAANDKLGDKSKSILVIDEASMVSTADMRDLMSAFNRANYARVILVGDVKQLDAVSAGTPFDQLQRVGMPTAIMTDIQRQRDDSARAAVYYAIKGEVKEAFNNIGRIKTPNTNQLLPSAIAETWLALRSNERAQTGIVVLTNDVREKVNAEIRETLKNERLIGADDVKQSVLHPLNLTVAEAKDAASYKVGDVVVPLRGYKSEGLKKGEVYVVEDKSERSHSLVLRPEKGGDTARISLAKDLSAPPALVAYERKERDFAAGDKVKFAITDRQSGVTNGAKGTIETIDQSNIRVRFADGKTATLPSDSMAARGLDHAYSATAHDFQGATVDRIIVGMSATETLSTQKAFYVNISRARDSVTLVTTDPKKLADTIEKNTGDRPAALDAYAQKQRDDAAALKAMEADKDGQKQSDSILPERTFKDLDTILDRQASKERQALKERDAPDIAGALKEIEQMQKVKEGPIR
ncbi:MobF family relaxase [Cereibacter sp. SYSU M97828]|nr:MobF family relaxase [Cereibacter flavus]